MKAILLAAGLGTRLRPITNFIPKCLVPICCKPLLYWWIKLLEQHGITDVLINLHYLPRKVK
jgi:mannose-1-phosphate guanylyltransferase